jgi:hypothetical protein
MQDTAVRLTKSSGPFALVTDHDKGQAIRQEEQRDIIEKGEETAAEGQLAPARQHPAGWRLDPFKYFAAPLDKSVCEGL